MRVVVEIGDDDGGGDDYDKDRGNNVVDDVQ